MVVFGFNAEVELNDFGAQVTHVVDASAGARKKHYATADPTGIRHLGPGGTVSQLVMKKQVGQANDSVVCLGFCPRDALMVGRISGALQLFHLRAFYLLDAFSIAEYIDAIAWEGPDLRSYVDPTEHLVWLGTKKSVILCSMTPESLR